MKRAPLIITLLIITAQIAWLLGVSIYNEIRIAEAPRMIVNLGKTLADPVYSDFSLRFTVKLGDFEVSEPSLGPEVLGPSLWWGETWGSQYVRSCKASDVPITCTPRPKPSDVSGAVELTRDSCLDVSVIWSQNPHGVWSFRLEAPGSSTDVLRDGEFRTTGNLSFFPLSDADNRDVPAFDVQPFHRSADGYRDSLFPLSRTAASRITNFAQSHDKAQLKLVDITAEMALVKGGTPVCVDIRIGGIPLKDALRQMDDGSFPLPRVPQQK